MGFGLSQAARRNAFRLTVSALGLISVPLAFVALVGLRARLTVDGAAPDLIAFWCVAAAGVALLLYGAWGLLRRRRAGRWCVGTGAVLAQLPIMLFSTQAPALALAGGCWAAVLVYLCWRCTAGDGAFEEPIEEDERSAVVAQPVLWTAGLVLLFAAYGAGRGILSGYLGQAAMAALLFTGCAVASVAAYSVRRVGRLPSLLRWWPPIGAALSAAPLLALIPTSVGPFSQLVMVLGALRLVVALTGAAAAHEQRVAALTFLWSRPALLLVLFFTGLSLVGGLLLSFPLCSAPGHTMEPLDGFFTAVSATCVTGLVVVDTATELSFAGQVMVLVLIQLGALGIMALSAMATLVIGGAVGGHTERALRDVAGLDGGVAVRRVIRRIGVGTFILEGVGAVCLLPVFLVDDAGFLDALFKAVFHAVSAFCNAGFALQSDSFESLQGDPLAMHVVASLVVLGGLGFGVLMAVWDLLIHGERRRSTAPPRRRLNLHVKLVLVTNVVLLLGAFLWWLVAEWDGSLAAMSFGDRLNNAWFQSVALRTAGFNSVDFGTLSHATIMTMLVWMFIGASPGSTGGGIKTTTVAVLFGAVVSVIRGRRDAEMFGRRFAHAAVYRAAAIVTISAAVVFFGTVALMLTQQASFERTLFEATSAFGTVGLSLGLTGELDSTGKLIVMMLMLVGRTGPLTMALLFRRRDTGPIRFAEEEVMVG